MPDARSPEELISGLAELVEPPTMSLAEADSGRGNHAEEAVCKHRVALIAFMTLILAGGSNARAGGNDLSICLDAGTKLEAGGDIADKDLLAAQQACSRAQQAKQEPDIRPKLDAAAVTVGEEQHGRDASRHSR